MRRAPNVMAKCKRLRLAFKGLLCVFGFYYALNFLFGDDEILLERKVRHDPLRPSLLKPAETQETRLERMKQLCAGRDLPTLINDSNLLGKTCNLRTCYLYYMEPQKLVFCHVSKVASTSFRLSFAELMNLTRDRTGFRLLKRVSPGYFHRQTLDDLFKVIFVRHPFSRIASAFSDKLMGKKSWNPSLFRKDFGPILQKHGGLRPNFNDTGLLFYEFVQYLINTPPEKFNIHWIPMSTMCQPCLLRYDFIGKLETFQQDFDVFWKRVPISSFLANNNTQSNQVKSFFEQLTWQELKALYQVYEVDFLLFDYDLDSFLGYYNINIRK